MKLLVTGGSGFIGSNFIRWVLTEHPEDSVLNLDKLTYAGNPANLADVEHDPRYAFVHGDIGDAKLVRDVARGMDAIVNFAAPSHVDRSILDPDEFLKTNVLGVHERVAGVVLDVGQIRRVAGVGELVEVEDAVLGMLGQDPSDEVRPDEPAAPRDQQLHPATPVPSASSASARSTEVTSRG